MKRYQGATFGFASRNFYVAFLAALQVDRNAEKFFGPLTHPPETQSVVVTLPDYVPIDALAKAFKADLGALRVLNPALRPPIWNGNALRAARLRIAGTGFAAAADIAAAWARLQPADRYVVQRNDGAHRARRGETLASIAAASGVSLSRLLAANGWSADRANWPRRDRAHTHAGLARRRLPAPSRRPRRRQRWRRRRRPCRLNRRQIPCTPPAPARACAPPQGTGLGARNRKRGAVAGGRAIRETGTPPTIASARTTP